MMVRVTAGFPDMPVANGRLILTRDTARLQINIHRRKCERAGADGPTDCKLGRFAPRIGSY